MSKVSSIILAAGSSKRMGKPNKLLLPINGEAIIRIVVKEYLKISNFGVYVVLGFQSNLIQNQLKDLNVNFIKNYNYINGKMSSVNVGPSTTVGLITDSSVFVFPVCALIKCQACLSASVLLL